MAKLSPELRIVFEEKDVRVMGALGCLGLSRIATFANIEQEPQHLRELLEKELGYTRDDDLADRAMVSNISEAWEAAKLRTKAVDQLTAARNAVGREMEIYILDGRSLRAAHARIFGELEDSEFPARDYLSWRFAQFDTGE